MIIADTGGWLGAGFGNRFLLLNNLLQLSHFSGHHIAFTPFKGLDMFKEIEGNIIFNHYQIGMGIYLDIGNIERLNLETITGAITEIKNLEHEFLTKSK